MSRPKIHHYVPRSVLRHFSIDGAEKNVWVFDKEKKRAYPEAISTAGGESGFNQLVVGGRGIVFEGIFDDVDGALPILLRKIINSNRVSDLGEDERQMLALLAVIQFLRVKIIRTSLKHLSAEFLRILEEFGGEPGKEISEHDVRRVGLSLLSDAKSIVPLFEGKELTLYRAPAERSFWTSDTPVIWFNHFPHGDLGFGARGVEIAWAIGPELTLSFRCPSVSRKLEESSPELASFLRTEPVLPCRESDVDWFNALHVTRSLRFLYSNQSDFSHAERILASGDSRETDSLFSVSKLGARKPGMPAGIALAASGRETEHVLTLLTWGHEPGGIRVQIADSEEESVKNLLADGPYQSVEITEEKGPCAGMREVTIERVSKEKIELWIEHADPALRALDRQIGESR